MLIADYLSDFHCIGSSCEETCCANWQINIDRDTYHRYKQNRHPALVTLFREHITRTDVKGPPASANFGVIKLDQNQHCPFLDGDKLCLIQKTLGAGWLSKVCSSYPRIVLRMDDTYEVSMTVSCPEAARVILNRRDPIKLIERPDDAALCQIARMDVRRGKGLAARSANEIRSMCIVILQARRYPVDARMMLLGEFLAGIDQLLASGQQEFLPSLFDNVAAYLSGEKDYLPEFSTYRGNISFKLQALLQSIVSVFRKKASPRFKVCLAGCNEGLGIGSTSEMSYEAIAQYFRKAHESAGKEFLSQNAHVLENYLVNLALNNLFPFGYLMEKLFDAYIRLALNYGMIKLVAVGMAGRPQGIADAELIQLIQSFSRWTDHAPNALKELHDMIASKGWNDLSSIAMTILDE